MSINPNRQEIVQDTDIIKMAKTDPKRDMRKMFEIYLANNPAIPQKKSSELEIRFKAPKGRRLTKTDYDNVIQHLYASGFTTSNPKGLHILRIQKQYLDPKKGITKLSNIRAEIVGVDLIQEYCRTNSIQKLLNMPSTMSAFSEKIKFTQKTPVIDAQQKVLMPVNFNDYNFRVGYQFEQEFGPRSELIRDMIESKNWADSKKVFRHLNRVKFEHPDLPVIADISIVRGSHTTGDVPIPEYTIQEAGVFENAVTYEIELELVNSRVTTYNTIDKLLAGVRKAIRIILSALQGSNYPIPNTEQADVLKSYLKILHGEKYDAENHHVRPRDFIGPNSVSLLMENILPIELSSKSNIPNIREHFSVTDKADGERKLMYIHDNGHIYFINTNMNVQFTGALTPEKKIYGSILDGEHIKYDKNGKFINLFAVFDIYYLKKRSLREYPFIDSGEEKEGQPAAKNFRITFMNACVKIMNPKSVTDSKSDDGDKEVEGCHLRVSCKEFYPTTPKSSIFDNCALILTKMRDNLFEYNTDGLIFTHMAYGVGGNEYGKPGKLQKTTWEYSFKWKPPHFNTIDFLVRVQKDKSDRDKVYTIFKDGMLMDKDQNALMYKKLILHCGFDEKIHGYLNPFQDIISGNIPTHQNYMEEVDENTYKARPFIPNNPFDENASICNIEIKKDGNGQSYMTTEDGDYFQENMIVEFKYDLSLTGGWRWVPIRVRHDKTSQLMHGHHNFGNDYTTANNNWKSIHNPVTEEIISTGNGWTEPDDEVYYNRKSLETNTRALRDFHNLYVKKRLITGVANPNEILIDMSVGKAGDLHKWQSAKLKFVLGIDISKDNIMNNNDGACARYLREAKKYPHIFGALFLNGNSALNIRNGQAFTTYKEQKIIRSVFGEGAQVRKELGDGVYKYHGIAQDGFHICSCQFTLHYFFENASTLHNFIRNVAECTRIGGTFIGTCFDGKSVFQLLANKEEGDGITIMRDGKKMFQIVKLYNQTGFPDDEESLGYPINVYQESINNVFREYLVNFEYFKTMMSNYGFELITKEEAVKIGLPGATGMFESLYYDMQEELKRNPNTNFKDAGFMSEDEKTISFLNRYFVFRKLRHVATKNVTQILGLEKEEIQEEGIEGITKKIVSKKVEIPQEKVEKKPEKKVIRFIRKIEHPKITINVYDPVVESSAVQKEAEEIVKPIQPVDLEKVDLEKAVEIVSIPEPEEMESTIKLAPPKPEKKTIRIRKPKA